VQRVEDALDVPVQGSHDADARKHRRPVTAIRKTDYISGDADAGDAQSRSADGAGKARPHEPVGGADRTAPPAKATRFELACALFEEDERMLPEGRTWETLDRFRCGVLSERCGGGY
jgi:hypothetical protein